MCGKTNALLFMKMPSLKEFLFLGGKAYQRERGDAGEVEVEGRTIGHIQVVISPGT